ncbi:MAG: hypothetical protein U0807_17345 [Candidatus Binatia bacterium]
MFGSVPSWWRLVTALLAVIVARPALALHRESPPAVRVTSTGTHNLPTGRQFSTNAFAFISDQDLLANGSTGPQIFIFSLLFFDCNAYTTRPGTPCPSPPRPGLFQITRGTGNPDNPSLSFRETQAYLAFEADGAFGGLTGPAATHRQIFLLNLVTNELITVTNAADGDSTHPSITNNGAVVVFESTAQLSGVPQPANVKQVYAYKRRWDQGIHQLLKITSGQVDSLAPMPDKNGSQVVFQSRANLLGDGADTGISQVFLADLGWNNASSTLFRITSGNGDSIRPYLADNHHFVIFESTATNFPNRIGGPASVIWTAPSDAGNLPTLTQRTTPVPYGDCHMPTLSFTDQRAGFLCTGDPLFNGTTGNRAFVLSLSGNDMGTLWQVTGRGDVQALNLFMGENFLAVSDNTDLTGNGACDYQLHIVDFYKDLKSGLEVYHAATSYGDVPQDVVPPAVVPPSGTNAMGNHTLFVGTGSTTTGSQFTVQTATATTTGGVSTIGGQIRLDVGPRSPFTGEAAITVPIDNKKTVFPPLDVPGLGAVCLEPRAAGTGLIDCDGGRADGTLAVTEFHGADPANPGCVGGCLEYDCPIPGPHLTACHGPVQVAHSGTMSAGDMLVSIPSRLSVSTFPGLDGVPCTADDSYSFRNLDVDLQFTTGTVNGTLNGVDLGTGSMTTSLTGTPSDCRRLVADDLEGTQLVGVVPLPDVPNVGGVAQDVLFSLRLEASRGPDQGACSPIICNADSDCSDGDPCNGVETCQNHTCLPGTSPCGDNDLCNGVEGCDPATGACLPGTAPNCDDGNLCTTDSCSPSLGCVHAATCDDGLPCNGIETCNPLDGSCGPGVALTCDDANPCTDDSCSDVLGCVFTDNTLPCDDSSLCTTNDTCNNGTCAGTPIVFCDDGDVCNGAETCNPATGLCVVGTALTCDDLNPCTDDPCDPTSGCYHTNNSVPCNDGNLCTNTDTCQDGTCQGQAVVCADNDLCNGTEVCDPLSGACVAGPPPTCDDVNPCTDDSCDATLGCVHTDNTGSCDDGNPCTTSDTCSGGMCGGTAVDCNNGDACDGSETCDPLSGACLPGLPIACDDGDACTADSCDAVLGCTATPLPNYDVCILAQLFTTLDSAVQLIVASDPLQLGGSFAARKLRGLVESAQNSTHTAAITTGGKRARSLVRAAARLEHAVRILDRGVQRGKADPNLAMQIKTMIVPTAIKLRTL